MRKEIVVSRKKKIVVTSILSFNVLACVAGLSLAWFMDNLKMNVTSEASINKSYFEGGDGTAGSPYLIKYPRQFYYFSWLQNMGYFNEKDDSGKYKQTYFKLIDDIDMSGYNLPPAGTTEYPFIGSFSGTKYDNNNNPIGSYTISNLNIVNDSSYTDEPKKKDESENRNYPVMGVFGVVGNYQNSLPSDSYNNSVISVNNLNLDNISIYSTTSSALAGIVAGYVNDEKSGNNNTLDNVKVSGDSTISSTANNPFSTSLTSRLSDYTLVGYTNTSLSKCLQDVDVKVPYISNAETGDGSESAIAHDGAGGDLVIAPSGLTNGKAADDPNYEILYESFTDVSEVTAVDGASDLPDSNPPRKSAYYYPSISSSYISVSTYRKYTGNAAFSGSTNELDITQQTSTQFTPSTQLIDQTQDSNYKTFLQYSLPDHSYQYDYDIVAGQPKGITFNGNVDFTHITAQNPYPTNCIWFKPMNTGQCYISFNVQNMSDSAYASIFRYKRDSDSVTVTNKQELKLCFKKGKGNVTLKNNTVVLFTITLNEDDLDYEYCIGKSAVTYSNTAYFYFLKLAGTDKTNGVAQYASKSQFAIYQQEEMSVSDISKLNGVYFDGDTTASFQLTKLAGTYGFVSLENRATTYTSTVDSSVSPNKDRIATILVQTISGYSAPQSGHPEDPPILQVEIRKITKIIDGETNQPLAEYQSKTGNNTDFSDPTTDTGLEIYFGQHSPYSSSGLFQDSEIVYHHEIADSNTPVLVKNSFDTQLGTELVGETEKTVLTISTHTIDTGTLPYAFTIDSLPTSTWSVILKAGSTQIYP